MKTYFNIKMPYSPQGKNSANCGPCSLKMIVDYYHVKTKKQELYSVNGLNKICKVSREFGTDFKNINSSIKRFGLKRQKVTFRTLKAQLNKKHPILSCFIDETGCGHYAIIKGYDSLSKELIFHDPYFGKNFRRKLGQFQKQLKLFKNWMWAIEKPL